MLVLHKVLAVLLLGPEREVEGVHQEHPVYGLLVGGPGVQLVEAFPPRQPELRRRRFIEQALRHPPRPLLVHGDIFAVLGYELGGLQRGREHLHARQETRTLPRPDSVPCFSRGAHGSGPGSPPRLSPPSPAPRCGRCAQARGRRGPGHAGGRVQSPGPGSAWAGTLLVSVAPQTLPGWSSGQTHVAAKKLMLPEYSHHLKKERDRRKKKKSNRGTKKNARIDLMSSFPQSKQERTKRKDHPQSLLHTHSSWKR